MQRFENNKVTLEAFPTLQKEAEATEILSVWSPGYKHLLSPLTLHKWKGFKVLIADKTPPFQGKKGELQANNSQRVIQHAPFTNSQVLVLGETGSVQNQPVTTLNILKKEAEFHYFQRTYTAKAKFKAILIQSIGKRSRQGQRHKEPFVTDGKCFLSVTPPWRLIKLSSWPMSLLVKSLHFCLNAHIAVSLLRKKEKLGHVFTKNLL